MHYSIIYIICKINYKKYRHKIRGEINARNKTRDNNTRCNSKEKRNNKKSR